jgi:hypothetical protein
MFYNKEFNKYVVEGNAFELDGVQYPANWLNLSTPEEKAAVGLQEVIATNSPADERFYWVWSELNGAELTYVNAPKQLDDSEEPDESGKLVKTTGLKTTWAGQIKNMVYTMLQPTDYIDIRNLRDPEYKVDWMTWRESVRTYSASTVTSIEACTTVDELANIVTNLDWPKDPDYVAPPVEEVVVG